MVASIKLRIRNCDLILYFPLGNYYSDFLCVYCFNQQILAKCRTHGNCQKGLLQRKGKLCYLIEPVEGKKKSVKLILMPWS